jgi:hypothetical protein
MTLKLSASERRMILDQLYNRFVSLGDEYYSINSDRNDKRRIRTERRALAKLINKLEGSEAIEVEAAV